MPTLTPRAEPLEARWRRDCRLPCCSSLASFAMLGSDRRHRRRRASGAKLARNDRPVAASPTGADWPAYGGTNAAWRYSPLTQIDASNVGKLRKVWEVHTGGLPTNPDYTKLYGTENTPLKVGNLLYTCTAKNVIVALDAATGKPVWRVDPKVPDKWIPYTTACRGLAYYQVPGAAANAACAARIIEGTLDCRLIAVDALTGKAVHRVQRHRPAGHQDRHGPGLSRARDDQFRADDRARDHRRPAPDPRRPVPLLAVGRDPGLRRQDRQARLGMGHAASRIGTAIRPRARHGRAERPTCWTAQRRRREARTGLCADSATSRPITSRPAEARRANQFSSSIVAIDVTSGKPRWKFQTVNEGRVGL